eukprot:TRINITY_DN16397_c0_g1_i1.p2 TRINITY_DN16397_c0_g1~~TRINITY_DN16397_c0_g1_i1.p2  ORF type:complete len:333 (+),score=119.04 TRINITY_DN16397_c0_g1_i1:90-1001(+)
MQQMPQQPSPQTLHVSHLPFDFADRELWLLFTTMPGFMRGHIKYEQNRQPIAFVTFDSLENAQIAMGATNGLPWLGGNTDTQDKFRVGLAKTSAKINPNYNEVRITTQGPRPGMPAGSATQQGGGGTQGGYAGGMGGMGSIMSGSSMFDSSEPARFHPYGGSVPLGEGGIPMAGAQMGMAAFAGGGMGAMGMGGMGMGAMGGMGGMGGGKGAQPAGQTTLYMTAHPTFDFDEMSMNAFCIRYGPPPQKITIKGSRMWVKYASPEAADQAQKAMHGAVCPEAGGGCLNVQFARTDSREPRSSEA